MSATLARITLNTVLRASRTVGCTVIVSVAASSAPCSARSCRGAPSMRNTRSVFTVSKLRSWSDRSLMSSPVAGSSDGVSRLVACSQGFSVPPGPRRGGGMALDPQAVAVVHDHVTQAVVVRVVQREVVLADVGEGQVLEPLEEVVLHPQGQRRLVDEGDADEHDRAAWLDPGRAGERVVVDVRGRQCVERAVIGLHETRTRAARAPPGGSQSPRCRRGHRR